jgi:hypothetical protein
MVIDDYLGGANKSERLRMQVDELVTAGRLEPLGLLRLRHVDWLVANPLIANSSSKARLTGAEKKFSLLRFEF